MSLFSLFIDKKVNSIEYDTCLKRISEISSALSTLHVEVSKLSTDVASMRARMNRKFGETKKDDDDDNNTMGDTYNGVLSY